MRHKNCIIRSEEAIKLKSKEKITYMNEETVLFRDPIRASLLVCKQLSLVGLSARNYMDTEKNFSLKSILRLYFHVECFELKKNMFIMEKASSFTSTRRCCRAVSCIRDFRAAWGDRAMSISIPFSIKRLRAAESFSLRGGHKLSLTGTSDPT